MWMLKQKENGECYLTFDRNVRRNFSDRGVWQFIGLQGSPEINRVVDLNQSNGVPCCKDDEGGWRALVLAD